MGRPWRFGIRTYHHSMTNHNESFLEFLVRQSKKGLTEKEIKYLWEVRKAKAVPEQNQFDSIIDTFIADERRKAKENPPIKYAFRFNTKGVE